MKSNYLKYKVHFWLVILIFHQIIFLIAFDGTGDDGDSITHYLHNKYAFDYPYLFIHLWAKPVFVFLSCGFAQLGMIGMKVFNSFCAIGAAYLSYKLAKEHEIRNPELAMPILMCMPRYFHHSLSALTEPLFSLMAVTSLLLLMRRKYAAAAFIIAWMPFSRPEGIFFIAAVFLFFLFIKKGMRYIPFLALGYLLMTVIGYFLFDQNLLWIFQNDPYPTLDAQYEETGTWLHFILGAREIFGLPIYILFCIGLLIFAATMYKSKGDRELLLHKLLLLGAIGSVFCAHTLFHKFAIFTSFGLLRVLLIICPLATIVALCGLEGLTRFLKPSIRQFIYVISIPIFVLYMYSGHKYTFNFPDDFKLQPQQNLANEVADYIHEEFPKTYVRNYYQPQLYLAFDDDPFNWKTFAKLEKRLMSNNLPGNTILIWDEWYAKIDGGVTEAMMNANSQIVKVKEFTTEDKWGMTRRLVVYMTKIWEK